MAARASSTLTLLLLPSAAYAYHAAAIRAPRAVAHRTGLPIALSGQSDHHHDHDSGSGTIAKTDGRHRRLITSITTGVCVAGAGFAGVSTGTAAALFHGYESLALASPIATKSATSAVAYLLGDCLAQKASGARKKNAKRSKLDTARVARSGVAGLISHGPQLHAWCLFLDRFVSFGGPGLAWARLAVKILLDQTFFSLYMNAAYCAIVETLSGRNVKAVWQRVRATAWPSLRSSWKFWPLVHMITYSVVPSHLRVLWVDAVEVVWVAILATCVSTAKAAPAPSSLPSPTTPTATVGILESSEIHVPQSHHAAEDLADEVETEEPTPQAA